jgi:hypothetical protein
VLPAATGDTDWLVDGRRTPGGATVDLVVPGLMADNAAVLLFTVECVPGVTVTFSVPRGELATGTCDPAAPSPVQMSRGQLGVPVSRAVFDRLGLRTGQRVRLTVTRSGRDTDQWRVYRPS